MNRSICASGRAYVPSVSIGFWVAGTRSGVNWMRLNSPPIEAASVLIAIVLARPGTPSTRRWPRARRATTIRSSRWSCPTMTFLISKSRRSIWLPGRTLVVIAVPFPLIRWDAEPGRCRVDRDREAHPAEHLTRWVDQPRDDTHNVSLLIHKWSAGIAGVHRGIELDESGDRLRKVGSGHRAIEAGDHAGRERTGEPERMADDERGVADGERTRIAE